MCDQLRHDCGGFVGHPLVRTPNIDRLAEAGVVFENAYCASPVCSPARASWLTGLYPHAHGQLINYGPGKTDRPGTMMRSDCMTIGDVLKREGYRCGIVGPWHLGNDHQPQHGFTDSWRAYRYQGKGHPDVLFDYFEREGVPNIYAGGATGVTNDGWHMGYTTIDDPRQQRTTWTIDRGLEFLADQDERPFLLFLSIKDPHPLIAVPPELLSMYPEEQIELPPTWADPLEGKPAYQHREVGRLPQDTDERRFRRMMAHYYALVTHIDRQVGRFVDRLAEMGLAGNTIVCFFSDHGEMLGEHGFTTKRVLYEGSARVPLVLSWPKNLPSGLRVRTPLAGVDLMPTLLELAGVDLGLEIDGRNVADTIEGGTEPNSRPVFAEIATWGAVQGRTDDQTELAAHMMVRDGAWKYVWDRLDDDELYDLSTDPHEMSNLASRPEQTECIARMRAQARDMLKRTGPGVYEWCLQG